MAGTAGAELGQQPTDNLVKTEVDLDRNLFYIFYQVSGSNEEKENLEAIDEKS